MKIINLLDGQPVDIADSGLPPELIGLLSILGEEPQLCDCPPGVCLGEGPASDTFDPDLVSDSGDENEEDDDDEFDIEFEPFFELSDEEMPQEDKVEAVAQLGRIIETLAVITEKHANLLKDLVS
jgi:hypothetical protein